MLFLCILTFHGILLENQLNKDGIKLKSILFLIIHIFINYKTDIENVSVIYYNIMKCVKK